MGRPSPAMMVACLALMIAMSGTGYAVTALPRNSVGTTQLKNDAVVSAKVKKGSLQGSDFATGQLPAGETGPIGPAGPTGAKGDKGDAGATGSAGPAGLKGDKGDPGATGSDGVAGPKGDKGDPGLRWRGTFLCDSTIYHPGDVVSQGGSSWVNATFSIGGCVGPPNDPWKLLASKGDAGPAGAAGPTGPTGPAGQTGPRGFTGLTGAQGPAGPQGPQGPPGPQGSAGTNGISGYEVIFASFSVNGLSKGGGAARCSAGKKVLGGGVRYSDMNMIESSPAGDVGGWEVETYNGSLGSSTARVYAVCANV